MSIPLIGYAPFLQKGNEERLSCVTQGVNSLNRVRSISTLNRLKRREEKTSVNSLNRVRSISTQEMSLSTAMMIVCQFP